LNKIILGINFQVEVEVEVLGKERRRRGQPSLPPTKNQPHLTHPVLTSSFFIHII
jgi:hypothetical protein